MSRVGNMAATVLVVLMILGAGTLLIQREVFDNEASNIQKALAAFSQNVYSSPANTVERFARESYGDVWYCGDYPSPPTVQSTKDTFPEFAEQDLAARLTTLAEEYPEFDIEISQPDFELLGAEVLADLPNDSVTINVSNLSITVRDGNRMVRRDLSEVQEYNYGFWLMYKVFQEWVRCNNAGIYNALDAVFRTKPCAFFKDICLCEDVPPSPGNPDPCLSPLKPEEGGGICTGSNPALLQDFTGGERDQLIRQYGVTLSDVQEAGTLIAKGLTEAFAGEPVCNESLVPEPTGITCRARIENAKLETGIRTSYAMHPTGCVQQVAPTCTIVPISTFDALACAGKLKEGLSSPERIPSILLEVQRGISGDCRVVPLYTNGVATQYVECGGQIIGPLSDLPPQITDCVWDPSVDSQGLTGSWDAAPDQEYVCNPLPDDADPRAIDIADQVYVSGDSELKCLLDRYPRPSLDMWFGMNGWLERRGTFDLVISCSDPGSGETRPFQADIRMHINFRHGCDTEQARARGWAPPMCRAPGTTSDRPQCPFNCDTGNPCYIETCQDVNGTPTCVPLNQQPGQCPNPFNECQWAACVPGENPWDARCDPTQVGGNREGSCGSGDDRNCNSCSNGVCQANPNSIGAFCSGISSNVCRTKTCQSAGSGFATCEVGDNTGVACGASGCGVCECVGTDESWTMVSDACGTQQVLMQCGANPVDVQLVCNQNTLNCDLPAGTNPQDPSECCGSSICGQGERCCPEINVCWPVGEPCETD